MAKFLDTNGYAHLAIAICARCKRKVPYSCLRPDQNTAGLLVCSIGEGNCGDLLDPYRLPPVQPDTILLAHPRPDVDISVKPTLEVESETGAFRSEDESSVWLLEANTEINNGG